VPEPGQQRERDRLRLHRGRAATGAPGDPDRLLPYLQAGYQLSDADMIQLGWFEVGLPGKALLGALAEKLPLEPDEKSVRELR